MIMIQGIVKLVLLGVAAFTTWSSTKPKPADKATQVGSWDLSVTISTLFAVRCIAMGVLGLEFLATAANFQPDDLLLSSCPKITASGNQVILTVALVCMTAGSLFRMWCYKELGSLFTFHISIQPNHKLITTGPYAIVRHPSYTGTLVRSIGMLLLTVAAFRDDMASTVCFGIGPIIKFLLLCVVAFYVTTTPQLLMRVGSEDDLLRRTFGSEWDKWAAKTPYRFFPGVI